MHICVQVKTVWTHASTFASYPKTLKTEEKAWNQSDSQTPQKKKKKKPQELQAPGNSESVYVCVCILVCRCLYVS